MKRRKAAARQQQFAGGGKPKPTRAIAERQEKLDPEKTKVLDELYYGKFKGGIGLQALWEALKSNPRQRSGPYLGGPT